MRIVASGLRRFPFEAGVPMLAAAPPARAYPIQPIRPPVFYASIGNGSEHHLAMELLKQQAGIDLVHVPYRGGGPAAIGVMAGDVSAMFGGGSVAPLIQGGKLKGLAVTGQRRSRLLPELPPLADVYPGYEVTIWQGLCAPVGTPPGFVQRRRGEWVAVFGQPG